MKRQVVWLAAGLTAILASPALAAEEESFFKEYSLAIKTIVAVINFVIFAWILLHYAGPKIKEYFAAYANEYQAKVAEAAKVLAEANALHAQWAERSARFAEESARLKTAAVQLAEAQARDLLAAARQTADRIVHEAQRTAEAELLRAKEDLRGELVDELLAKTTDKLRERLTPSHQHVLIEEAIKKLEASR
jgi:F-type H+-transporting ATPase subunit b